MNIGDREIQKGFTTRPTESSYIEFRPHKRCAYTTSPSSILRREGQVPRGRVYVKSRAYESQTARAFEVRTLTRVTGFQSVILRVSDGAMPKGEVRDRDADLRGPPPQAFLIA